MKKVLIISALGAMFMASCADEFDQTYQVGRPDMTAEGLPSGSGCCGS